MCLDMDFFFACNINDDRCWFQSCEVCFSFLGIIEIDNILTIIHLKKKRQKEEHVKICNILGSNVIYIIK